MHGTPGLIQRAFLGGKPYAKNVKVRTHYHMLIQAVEKDPNAFAFCLTEKSLEAKEKNEIKTVAISNLTDSPAAAISWESISDASYPLRRPNYFHWEANASRSRMSAIAPGEAVGDCTAGDPAPSPSLLSSRFVTGYSSIFRNEMKPGAT